MPPKRTPTSNTEPCVSAWLAQKHSQKDGNLVKAGIAPKGRSVIPDQTPKDLPPDHPDSDEAMDTTSDQHSAKGSAPSGSRGRTRGSHSRTRATCGRARGTRGHTSSQGRGRGGHSPHGKTPAVQGSEISGTEGDNDVDDADEEDPDFNDEPEAPPASAKNVVCFYFVQCSHLYLPLLRQSRVITTPDLQTLRTALSKAKTSAFLGFETGSQGSGSGMLSSCYLQCVPTDQNISYLNQSVLMNQDLRVSRR